MEEKYLKLKDSLSQVQALIPAVSSVIVRHKQIEINLFNSLISANTNRDVEGKPENLPFRQTYFYNSLQVTYGFKDHLNLGFDINSTSARMDYNRKGSVLHIFSPDQGIHTSSGINLTSIGPRVRWRPIKRNYRLIMQGHVWFPTYGNSDNRTLLGLNQTYLSTQIFYNQPLTNRLFLFSQLGIQYGVKNNLSSSIFILPLAGYLCYLMPPKIVLFGLAGHNQLWSKNTHGTHTTQVGLGVQYQFSERYFINGFYANEIEGKNYNIFDTYSISLRALLN